LRCTEKIECYYVDMVTQHCQSCIQIETELALIAYDGFPRMCRDSFSFDFGTIQRVDEKQSRLSRAHVEIRV